MPFFCILKGLSNKQKICSWCRLHRYHAVSWAIYLQASCGRGDRKTTVFWSWTIEEGNNHALQWSESFMSFVSKANKAEPHKKNSSQAAGVNSAIVQIGNSRYAVEGPLTTNTSTPTYPRNKRSLTYNDRMRASKLKKEEQEPSSCPCRVCYPNSKRVCTWKFKQLFVAIRKQRTVRTCEDSTKTYINF